VRPKVNFKLSQCTRTSREYQDQMVVRKNLGGVFMKT
jgi:hypothetical protein